MEKRWLAWFVVVGVCFGVWSVGEAHPVSAADTDSAESETVVSQSASGPASDSIDGTSPGEVPDLSVTQRGCQRDESPHAYYNRCVPWFCQYGRSSDGTCEPDSPSLRYHRLTCSSYSTDADAAAYLDMDPDHKNDRAVCPPPGLFLASPGTDDWPVWGFEKSIADDYGKVVVEKSGECSGPADSLGLDFLDTGPTWDFQIPCKAHDHCFDLIRAGLSGTVSSRDCDARMNDLMKADCNNRRGIDKSGCNRVRKGVRIGVWLSSVGPDPGLVRLVNDGSGMCADIDRSVLPNGQLSDGLDDGTVLLQWPCRVFSAENQQFRLRPSTHRGYFEIRPEHSIHLDKCITAVATTLVLATCERQVKWFSFSQEIPSAPAQSFKVTSVANSDRYIFTSRAHEKACWAVPSINGTATRGSGTYIPGKGTALLATYCTDSYLDQYQIWRIENANS